MLNRQSAKKWPRSLREPGFLTDGLAVWLESRAIRSAEVPSVVASLARSTNGSSSVSHWPRRKAFGRDRKAAKRDGFHKSGAFNKVRHEIGAIIGAGMDRFETRCAHAVRPTSSAPLRHLDVAASPAGHRGIAPAPEFVANDRGPGIRSTAHAGN